MKIDIGDYQVRTDDKQYILQSKNFTLSKDNKELHKVYGYYSSLPVLLNNIANQIVLDNDDICIIKEKLDELKSSIEDIKKGLNIISKDNYIAPNAKKLQDKLNKLVKVDI